MMQTQRFCNNVQCTQDSGFGSEHINDSSELQGPTNPNNFMDGLLNARKLLSSLEKSIRKTDDYERRLMNCKKSHPHSHEPKVERKKFKKERQESSRRQLNPNDSWSTMSLGFLQYQYEDLTERYNSLSADHNDLTNAMQRRDARLQQLETSVKGLQKELTSAHQVILIVGEKCLALTRQKELQKKACQAQLAQLKATLQELRS